MKDHELLQEMSLQLEAGLKEWRLRTQNPQYRPKPVLTITCEPGCEGESIAQRIAAELGMRLYDRELVERIARDAQVSTELVASIEKNPRSEFIDFAGDLPSELRKVYHFSSEEYLESLKRVLLAIVVPGNAIIVGRGSNFFLPRDKKIGLCFAAPLSVRIQNLMKQLGLTEKAARKHISELEAEHQKLVKKYFQADIRDPDAYHLIINTALVQAETIVQIVKLIIQATEPTNQNDNLNYEHTCNQAEENRDAGARAQGRQANGQRASQQGEGPSAGSGEATCRRAPRFIARAVSKPGY